MFRNKVKRNCQYKTVRLTKIKTDCNARYHNLKISYEQSHAKFVSKHYSLVQNKGQICPKYFSRNAYQT